MRLFGISRQTGVLIRFTIIVLSVAVALSVGCKREYKLLEIREGFVHFSFEYPASYDVGPDISIPGGDSGTTVRVGKRALGKIPLDMALTIFAQKIAPDYNAEYRYEYESGQRSSDPIIHIIERSTISEGIISGKVLTFSDMEYSYNSANRTIIHTEIFFDVNAATFRIASLSEERVSKQAKADLNHMLRTFKILD